MTSRDSAPPPPLARATVSLAATPAGRATEALPDDDAPPPAHPAVRDGDVLLGKYRVEGVLGAGGMGIVVAATHLHLGTRVAVKLLRPGKDPGGLAAARLLREARSAASIEGEHVVRVLDVEALDTGTPCIVMERLDGRDLGAELAARGPLPVEDAVDYVLQACEAVAQAHAAGIVHRDLKPSNLFLAERAGGSAVIKVLDFGIAKALDGEPGAALTASSALLGSPVYMSPEQIRSASTVDHRADVWSLGVILFELLSGRLPFEGGSASAHLAAIAADPPMPLGKARPDAPAGLEAVILRCLEKDVERRTPDVAALARALAPFAPARAAGSMARIAGTPAAQPEAVRAAGAPWRPALRSRRPRVLLGAGALVLAGLAAGFLARRPAAALCRGGEARLAEAWDGAARARVREAFAGTGRPYAEDTYQRVARALDERAGAWVAMYTDSCEATQVRGEQSAELLDLRTQCLERRRGELRALTALFARGPDPDVLDRAVAAAGSLPALDACANAEALRAAVPLPADPSARAAVEATRARIAEAGARLFSGKVDEAAGIASSAVAEARKIGWAPLEAEALAMDGFIQGHRDTKAAETTLREAAVLAAKARDDRLLAEIMIDLVDVVGARQGRIAEALAMETPAMTAIERAGGDPLLRARCLARVADVLRLDHRTGEALVKSREALALTEAALPAGAPAIAKSREELCLVLTGLGRNEEARGCLEQTLAAWEESVGPDHWSVAQTLTNLGGALYGLGKIDEAIAVTRRAIAVFERALGPETAHLTAPLNNLATMLVKKQQFEEALALHRRNLAILEKREGPDHPHVATALYNLAVLYDQQGRRAEALPYYERALARREKAYGPDHPEVAQALASYGDALAHVGRPAEGIAALERSIAIYDKRGETDTDDFAAALTYLGSARLEQRKPAEALPPLERALLVREAHAAERDPLDLAETRFALGRALWDAGRDRRRAIDLAQKARDAWVTGGEDSKTERARAEAWLASHPSR